MLIFDVTPNGSVFRECFIWFAEAPFRPDGYEVVTFKETQLEILTDRFAPQPFDTLWSDLTLSEYELWARLNRGKKSNVSIARKRAWSLHCGNDDADIRLFHAAQSAFAAAKQIGPPVALEGLQRNAAHCLAAFVHDSEGKLICWNFYILDKPIARLWYAGSDLAYPIASDRGYAAALLHWNMMLHFKKEGFETYDWGGVVLDSSDPRNTITQFKLSFGGSPERRFDYSCRFPLSPPTRFWRKLIRKLGLLNLYTSL